MSEVAAMGMCDRADCDYAATGTCAAGHEVVDHCPHVRRQPVNPPDSKSNETVHGVNLPSGRSMQPEQSFEISRASPTRFLIVAGAADSGKTTLLASIHERFLRGPFAGYNFGGCKTFFGFERICHPGRGVSQRAVPDTERTKRTQGRQLLHLRVRTHDASRPAQDLLLSDLSGEEFDAARDSAEEARRLMIVKAAHHLVLLVDGEKLSQMKQRQRGRDEATMLLRSFLEQGLVGKRSRVDVLFSKWDLAGAPAVLPHTEPFAAEIENDLRGRFEQSLGRIRFFKVTARDPGAHVMPASGLELAFPAWVEEGSWIGSPEQSRLTVSADACEYDRFYQRQLPHLFEAEAK